MIVLSASGWIAYKQCPQRYNYSRIERIKVDEVENHSYAIPGSTVHKASEQFLSSFEDKAFSEKNIRAIFEEVIKNPENDINKYVGGPNKAWEFTLQCAKNMHMFLLGQDLTKKDFKSEYRIGTWQEPCVISSELGLMGDLDLVVPAGLKHVLYDYKATYQRKNVDPDQLKIYKLGSERKLKISIASAGFFFIPLSQTQFFLFKESDMQYFVDRMHTAVKKITAGDFEKICTDKCKNCRYYNLCKPESKVVPVAKLDINFNEETPSL